METKTKIQRKPNRLKSFNYSQNGYYFVTICTKKWAPYFGKIENGKMILNRLGEIIRECWSDLPTHYGNCKLDVSVIMPNHIHGIIVIDNNVGDGFKPSPTGLSEIVRGFKTFSSRKIHAFKLSNHFRWQRSFFDHVIRDDKSLDEIREYIVNNPLKWELDRNNPKNLVV